MSISARQIVNSANMSSRPEYYSGYGTRLDLLGPEHLTNIYTAIKENIGENEANEFIKMIENIDSLAPTNFLNCLYSLESNNWKYEQFEESNIDLGPDTKAREVIGLGTIFAMSYNNADYTQMIKRAFFEEIGYTPVSDDSLDNTKHNFDNFMYPDELWLP